MIEKMLNEIREVLNNDIYLQGILSTKRKWINGCEIVGIEKSIEKIKIILKKHISGINEINK